MDHDAAPSHQWLLPPPSITMSGGLHHHHQPVNLPQGLAMAQSGLQYGVGQSHMPQIYAAARAECTQQYTQYAGPGRNIGGMQHPRLPGQAGVGPGEQQYMQLFAPMGMQQMQQMQQMQMMSQIVQQQQQQQQQQQRQQQELQQQRQQAAHSSDFEQNFEQNFELNFEQGFEPNLFQFLGAPAPGMQPQLQLIHTSAGPMLVQGRQDVTPSGMVPGGGSHFDATLEPGAPGPTMVAVAMAAAVAAEAIGVFTSFDVLLDHFSRISQLHTTPHTRRLIRLPMLFGC